MRRDFTDRFYYRVLNTALTFFTINFWFLVTNGLFIIVLFLFEPTIENAVIYILSTILTAPAIAASFFAMGKLLEDGDINATQMFFQGYRKNFKSAFSYGFSQLVLISILSLNYLYLLESNLHVLLPITLILMIGVLLTNLYAFPLLVRYNITLKNLWIISIVSFYKYFPKTLLNLFVTVSFGFLLFHHATIVFLTIASVLPYIIMYNLKDVLVKIGEQYQ